MVKSSIRNALIFSMVAIATSACASTPEPERIVEVRTVPVNRAAPIVPPIDTLDTREVTWRVLTEENYESVMAELAAQGQSPVLFAVDSRGYQNLSLNQADALKVIRQQNRVIAVYRKSYFETCC